MVIQGYIRQTQTSGLPSTLSRNKEKDVFFCEPFLFLYIYIYIF